MNKYIIIILATATLGYFAWRKFSEKKPEAVKVAVRAELSTQKTLQNTDLHKAFAKIVEKENKKKKRNLTIDELIEENLKNGSIEMTPKERKLVIEKLGKDIERLEKKFAITDGDELNEIEIKLSQKREQLENFQQIEARFPGENFENN
jgi:hypothetical protein